MDDRKRIRFIAFYLFIFFLAIYLLTASPNNIYNTDAGELRVEVARSIVERLDFNVPEGRGIKGIDGRDYSWVGIGSALLAVPFYIAGNFFGGQPDIAVSVINQILGSATAVIVFLFAFSLGYSKKASLLTAFFYGLGTFAWPMAKQPFDHPAETFFVLLFVYLMYRYITTTKIPYLLISALAFGLAFITRQTSVLAIPPVFIMAAIYYSKRHNLNTVFRLLTKDVALFTLTFLPFVILIFWYNYYRFGSIFETGYQLIATRTGLDFFSGTSLLTGLAGFLISPGKGFYYYSPVAVLFFFSVKHFAKKHIELFICFSLIVVSYLIFLSKNIFWHGDWAWGPRYIFILTPFFVIPLAGLLNSEVWMKKIALKVCIFAIFVISLIVQIAAVSVDFQKYFLNLQLYEKVKFVTAYGEGIQPIVEPPPETYFDCKRSPILAQFRFIHEIAKNIRNYKYSEPPENANIHEKIMADPLLNVFDFWWLYVYFIKGNYYGFVAAFILFACAIVAARRLWKLLNSLITSGL